MKKYLTIILSVLMIFGTLCTSFAEATINETDIKTKDERPETRKLPGNVVFGKIKSINASTVTLELATRKEMKNPENEKNNDGIKKPPEKPNKEQGDANNNSAKPEKPNIDDLFTLTGETKTINIAQADFGKDFENDFEKGFKPNETKQNENEINKLENHKEKTYADYSVGDYVVIETTDSTYSTAKSVRDASRMGGGPGGPRGQGYISDKKNSENKNN